VLPYLLHLLDVCSIALRHGADEDLAIAALLHDVVEDGGGAPMLDEIRDQFDDRVGDIVLACSDSLEVDPAKPDWWQRKIQYTDHAEFGDVLFERFKTGRVGTLWYYRRTPVPSGSEPHFAES
jgi:(p)ppGpp synthase/HD superfamily hydrolase